MSIVFPVNSIHAMDKVREWNVSNTSLHPKTCAVLLKFLRTSFPETINAKELMEQCSEIAGPHSTLAEALYKDILKSTFIGRTIEDLLVSMIMLVQYCQYDVVTVMSLSLLLSEFLNI